MRQARSRKMLPRRARRSKKMSLAGMKALVRNKKRFKASSGKYAQVAVLDANKASFGSDLLKVFTENVAKGGHDVPSDKIIERRQRSLDQLPWFLAQADDAWLFDNSNAKPRLIGTK